MTTMLPMVPLKGTSNCLAEFKKNIETNSNFPKFSLRCKGYIASNKYKFVDLFKNFIDMFMKYLCLHHVVK